MEVCPALDRWLAPYHVSEGRVASSWQGLSGYVQSFRRLREELGIPPRRNGLRHGFCTYHFALHANENLTAALAGNSLAMIHAHDKGLATKGEAEAWFNVKPAQPGNVVVLEQRAEA